MRPAVELLRILEWELLVEAGWRMPLTSSLAARFAAAAGARLQHYRLQIGASPAGTLVDGLAALGAELVWTPLPVLTMTVRGGPMLATAGRGHISDGRQQWGRGALGAHAGVCVGLRL